MNYDVTGIIRTLQTKGDSDISRSSYPDVAATTSAHVEGSAQMAGKTYTQLEYSARDIFYNGVGLSSDSRDFLFTDSATISLSKDAKDQNPIQINVMSGRVYQHNNKTGDDKTLGTISEKQTVALQDALTQHMYPKGMNPKTAEEPTPTE